MNPHLLLLCGASVTIALIHTLCGPDHYVPFVAMSRAAKWSMRRTVIVTLISGIGHVGSSVLLGCIGIVLGEVVTRLEIVEQTRGKVAGWMLICFGFAYLVWGIYYSRRRRPHMHMHGIVAHTHENIPTDETTGSNSHAASDHCHHDNHSTIMSSGDEPQSATLTPWILFTIFVFGPCEPLIPLLMYPAAQASISGVILVTLLFSVTTIATMLAMVICLVQGTKIIHVPGLQVDGHAVAGMVVMLCGIAINSGL